MCDCLMQEQIGLRQQVGSLTASLHAAEQAQGNAEVAAQEERQRHAEAAQVNRLTLFPFPFPFPFLPMSAHVECSPYCCCKSAKCKTIQLPASPLTLAFLLLCCSGWQQQPPLTF